MEDREADGTIVGVNAQADKQVVIGSWIVLCIRRHPNRMRA